MSPSLRVCSLLIAGIAFLPAAFAQQATRTASAAQAFRNVERIESEFRRGVTTRADVRRLLGEPTGAGGSRFPTAKTSQEVWSYEEVQMDIVSMTGEDPIKIQSKQRWKAILIFFEGDRFVGFFWFTSGGEATGVAR